MIEIGLPTFGVHIPEFAMASTGPLLGRDGCGGWWTQIDRSDGALKSGPVGVPYYNNTSQAYHVGETLNSERSGPSYL